MTQSYAGIGSRETPADILKLMHDLAVTLAASGWILRSGGANGADQAFLSGAINTHTHRHHCVETYLPWPSFEKESLDWLTVGARSHVALSEPAPWTFPIAAQHHPRWATLTPGAQRLHARNVHQILGRDERWDGQVGPMHHAVRFVVCWTPDGLASGGTGQAIRIADEYGVEVRNLHDDTTRRRAEAFVAGR